MQFSAYDKFTRLLQFVFIILQQFLIFCLDLIRRQHEELEQRVFASEEKAKAEADKAEAEKIEMQRLLDAMEELKKRLNAAESGKPLLGLPANAQKRVREEDNASVSTPEDLVLPPSPGPSIHTDQPRLPKIPKKMGDWPSQFNAANERISFVPGWQPIYKGTGLLITMPKNFKEKILKNEFFSYRALHKALTKPKVPVQTTVKSLVDKLVQEDDAFEKDTMRLLDLAIYQTQLLQIDPRFFLPI